MFSVGELRTWPAHAAGWRGREWPWLCENSESSTQTGTAAASFYTSSVRLSRESGTGRKNSSLTVKSFLPTQIFHRGGPIAARNGGFGIAGSNNAIEGIPLSVAIITR